MERHFLIKLFLILGLLSPLLWLTSQGFSLTGVSEVGETLVRTFIQAGLSTVLALALGVLSTLGILALQTPRTVFFWESFLLLPQWIPVIFILLSSFAWAHAAGINPQGLGFVIGIHACINSGLVTVALLRALRSNLGGAFELARIEGASLYQLWTVLLKEFSGTLTFVGFCIFCFCFSSFAIPLMVGGSQAASLEVLIFKKIAVEYDLSGAVTVAWIQMIFLFFFSYILYHTKLQSSFLKTSQDLKFLSLPLLAPLPLLTSGFVLSGLLFFNSGGERIFSVWPWEDFALATWKTFLLGWLVGLESLALMALMVWIFPRGFFRRFLLGFVAPSSVITGMALLLTSSEDVLPLFKISLGLTLIFVPACYRLFVDPLCQRLKDQVEVAQVLGATNSLIFKTITWPRGIGPLTTASGLCALWACGDFALSSLIAKTPLTLGLVTKSLLESYRLRAATDLLWILLAVGIICFLSFLSLGQVLKRRVEI